jgi:hypothetical protein
MKSFARSLIAAAALAVAVPSFGATTVLNNWYFDPNGPAAAPNAPQQINEYLDINGNAFINLTPTGGGTFSFTEYAVFNSSQADSNGQLFPVNYPGGNITATFSGFGTGTFGSGFIFTGGQIDVYQDVTNDYGTSADIYGADNGTLIGSFAVQVGGGGAVDANGSPLANGQITVFASVIAGTLAQGYFFDPMGVDLFDSTNLLAFSFTNANTIGSPTGLMVDEIICQGAGFTGAGCDGSAYANAPGDYIFVSNNGQFKLATEVPEPGALSLAALGLLGVGFASRRRKQRQ